MRWWPAYGARQITFAVIVIGALLGLALGGLLWALLGLFFGWLIGAGFGPIWARMVKQRQDPAAARDAYVRDLITRWEWRLVGSDEGQREDKRPALAEQSQAELQAYIDRARAPLAAEAAAAKVAAEAARKRAEKAAEQIPPDPPAPAASPAPPREERPRFMLGVPMAVALTGAVVVLAVLATGAIFDLTQSSTFIPLAAITILAAVMGGVAGATLTWERTRWAIALSVAVLVLGSVSAYLVAWVAGLPAERRALLTVLFIMLSTMSAAIWAFRTLAAQPREIRKYEKRERRKYEKALEERNSALAKLKAAQAAQAEADRVEHRETIELESFDKVASDWRQELTLVGQRATR